MKDPLTRLATFATLSPKGERAGIPVINPRPLGESDFWTPMGSIGPQKSGRVPEEGVREDFVGL
jgi:hypothetical protein